MQQPSITASNGSLEVRTPKSDGFLAEFKSKVPPDARRFDWDKRAWIVSPQFGQTVVNLIARHYGTWLNLPANVFTARMETRLLELRYLGAAKDRGGDQPTAFGWDGRGWNITMPLDVLKTWFCQETQPDEAVTLYGVLGIARDATAEQIKKAYRAAARTYHPDVNKEPDAHEQFLRVQQAYEMLFDPNKRARYDAGLALEASMKQNDPTASDYSAVFSMHQNSMIAWHPPIRCGWVMAEGQDIVGRFQVSKIIEWQDIIDSFGRVLVTSWPMGADRPSEAWA